MSSKDDLLWLVGVKTKQALNERLMSAVVRGNENAVKKLIRLGADVNNKTPISPEPQKRIAGPLMASLYYHQQAISKILLEAGADPTGELSQCEFYRQYTPLGLCLASSHYAEEVPTHAYGLMHLMIEKGADINKIDGNGFTLLSSAAQRRNAMAVQMLLKLGAKVSVGQSVNDDAHAVARSMSSNKEVVIAIEAELLKKFGEDSLNVSTENLFNISGEKIAHSRMRL